MKLTQTWTMGMHVEKETLKNLKIPHFQGFFVASRISCVFYQIITESI